MGSRPCGEESVSHWERGGELGGWAKALGESLRWPLVIRALQSSPPGEGWWRCWWAAGRLADAGAHGRQQPGWRKAGGSPGAGRAGSAGGSRYMQTATRSLLPQRHLQRPKHTVVISCASVEPLRWQENDIIGSSARWAAEHPAGLAEDLGPGTKPWIWFH